MPRSLTVPRPTRGLLTVSALGALLLAAVATGATERSIVIGRDDAWSAIANAEDVIFRPGRRGYLDATLAPYRHATTPTTELLLHFDELPLSDASGRHDVTAESPELTRTAQRTGIGALLVDGPEDRVVLTPSRRSAFAPGTEWSSFTIDLWFYPVALTDGDRVVSWRAREGAQGGFRRQELALLIDRGTTVARFDGFFVRPDGSTLTVELRAQEPLIPRSWSHHLIRFDGTTGLLEYVIDGRPVDVTYVSRTGRQDGSVFFPRIAPFAGEGLVVGDGIVGVIDELRIEQRFLPDEQPPRFPPEGGELVSDFIDLGSDAARLIAVDAQTDTPGLTDVFLSYRLLPRRGPAPTLPDEWTPLLPDTSLAAAEGRFLQLRAELYPDTRDGLTPVLSEITIVYEPDPPPLPPSAVRVTPGDGSVTLEWASVQEPDIEGYLVYYGDRSGRYFGMDSDLGSSPIDVGTATSITIRGLENGRLYFFAVQAYDRSRSVRFHDLSREVAARPARVYR